MAQADNRVLLAAALIASGQFRLDQYTAEGALAHPAAKGPTGVERLALMAEIMGRPDFEWEKAPMLLQLRKLTGVLERALTEPLGRPGAV